MNYASCSFPLLPQCWFQGHTAASSMQLARVWPAKLPNAQPNNAGRTTPARGKEVHHVMQVLKRVTTITIRTVMVTATTLCRKKSALNPIPKPYILNPNPQILNPKPYTQTLHPKTQALNPKLEPLRPKLQALNPTCSIALGFRAWGK